MDRYLNPRHFVLGSLLLAVVPLAGCGGPENIGRVSGIVTLNGEPLPGAHVEFSPKAGGRPASGITNASGKYTLMYTREVQGVEIGDHTVRISTFTAADPDAEPPKPAVPEKVPPRYNGASELLAKVEPGSNAIDFHLEASGPIAQPSDNPSE